jgi:hypothetical protein
LPFFADGHTTADERAVLESFTTGLGLTGEVVNQIFSSELDPK